MVDQMRNKWCDDLEDLLQCPICMERPSRWIYQCIQGHHVCQTCKPQLERCPTCTQTWSPSRNRLAEDLCLKLDEIKLSLINPEDEINVLLVPETRSVSCQTDEEIGAAAARAVQKKPINANTAGSFHCKIGNCTSQLFYEPLLKHLEERHAKEFSKLTNDESVFEHSWIIECTEQMIFDRAFDVTNMGTFFLKLSTDIFLNFTGFILMASSGFFAKHFSYEIEVACCSRHDSATYVGEVCSCRTPPDVIRTKCLRIQRSEMQRMMNHTKQLTCTLRIGKKPDCEETEPSDAKNSQKKKYLKNRFHQGKNSQNGTNFNPSFHRTPAGRAPHNQRIPSLMAHGLPSSSRSNSCAHLDQFN